MEKSKDVLMSKGDFGWSDVGSWSSLLEIWKRDSANNALRGANITIDTKNCLLHNPGKLTALIQHRGRSSCLQEGSGPESQTGGEHTQEKRGKEIPVT